MTVRGRIITDYLIETIIIGVIPSILGFIARVSERGSSSSLDLIPPEIGTFSLAFNTDMLYQGARLLEEKNLSSKKHAIFTYIGIFWFLASVLSFFSLIKGSLAPSPEYSLIALLVIVSTGLISVVGALILRLVRKIEPTH